MVGGSITFLTPIVIATIETFALQKDGSVKIPKRPKLVYAIKQCARTLGASEKESEILSERLADRIEGLWLNSGGNAISSGAASTGTFPFMIWESDKHGVPLPVRKGDAEVISDILKGTKQHDIVIHGGLVTVRQSGRKSANVPCEGIMLNLLTLLIRYKNLELTARELYESAWRTGEGTPQASQLGNDEKGITANNLRAPLCRLRKGIAKKSSVKSFAIENVRSLGYRCEGAFTYCLILPAADEPKTRIARLA